MAVPDRLVFTCPGTLKPKLLIVNVSSIIVPSERLCGSLSTSRHPPALTFTIVAGQHEAPGDTWTPAVPVHSNLGLRRCSFVILSYLIGYDPNQ
jgi:hypothetical protein